MNNQKNETWLTLLMPKTTEYSYRTASKIIKSLSQKNPSLVSGIFKRSDGFTELIWIRIYLAAVFLEEAFLAADFFAVAFLAVAFSEDFSELFATVFLEVVLAASCSSHTPFSSL